MSTLRSVDPAANVVTYRFRFEDGSERNFEVLVGRHDDDDISSAKSEPAPLMSVDNLPTAKQPVVRSTTTLPVWRPDADVAATFTDDELPEWTRLEVHQCAECPLAVGPDARCPPAVDCAAIVQAFESTSSIELADVVVHTAEREIHKRTDMQSAIGSLMGLVMATSGCPILGRFRGLAEFHLPFATPRETLFRAVGSHLLEQYFAQRRGGAADLSLDSLRSLYESLQRVNTAFVTRVRRAAKDDANLNALVLWFSVAVLVAHSVEDGLADLEGIFGAASS